MTSTQVQPVQQSSDLESYILLPENKYHEELVISVDRAHHGKSWFDARKALYQENSFMLTIRQYVDFLKLLKSGKVFKGTGRKMASERITALLDDILAIRNPYRAEWLDARFVKVNDRMYILSGHRVVDNEITPTRAGPLEECLMEDCYVDLFSANSQGLPTKESKKQEVYFYPPRGSNSVARFEADSDGVRLGCDGDPTNSIPGLGVRSAKFLSSI